ncbi:MAG TPA: NUDIX domain-containing protein [Candidatus Saccharimonadales bacterium]|nr:NUDIX domain-containing protein [Candidatus Saccharimonadales bacterium]
MHTLLTLRDSDVFPGSQNNDPSGFSLRRAARAVILNHKDQVALLKVGKWYYHKLPGGGVEASEDMQLALERELLEEVGCRAEIVQEVGEIIEFQNEASKKQISHCWLARQIGDATEPSFTSKEQREGFAVVWADDIASAIALLSHDKPTDYTGNFIRQRDLRFLEAAKALS